MKLKDYIVAEGDKTHVYFLYPDGFEKLSSAEQEAYDKKAFCNVPLGYAVERTPEAEVVSVTRDAIFPHNVTVYVRE